MEDLKDRLVKFRKDYDLTQPVMADIVGIGYRTYQSIESTGTVKKSEDLQAIEAKLSEDPPVLTPKNENTKISAHAKSGTTEKSKSVNSIDRLIDANKTLAESNKIYAEAHKKIADTNERLSIMLEKTTTENAAKEMIEGALARERAIWEVLQVYATEGRQISIERFEVDVSRRIGEMVKAGAQRVHTRNG